MSNIYTEPNDPPQSDVYAAAVEVYHLPLGMKKYFDKYFILHWTPQYLLSKWGDDPIIIREGIHYYIANRERKDVECWIHDPYVRLSFRKLIGANYGFVLIRRGKQS